MQADYTTILPRVEASIKDLLTTKEGSHRVTTAALNGVKYTRIEPVLWRSATTDDFIAAHEDGIVGFKAPTIFIYTTLIDPADTPLQFGAIDCCSLDGGVVTQPDGTPYKYAAYCIDTDGTKLVFKGYYLDGLGNLKSVKIKHHLMEALLNNYTNGRFKLKCFEEMLGSPLKLVEIDEGYDNPDLPSSCMKECGSYFAPFKGIAKMLLFYHNGRIAGRCNVWDGDYILKDTSDPSEGYLGGQWLDWLYYTDGKAHAAFIAALIADGRFKPIYGFDNGSPRAEFENASIDCYKAGISDDLMAAVENESVPWLDTFPLFCGDSISDIRYLRFYSWKQGGYSDESIDNLFDRNYDLKGVALSQRGDLRHSHEGMVELVNGDWADESEACYVCIGSVEEGYHLIEDCHFSEYHDEWIHDEDAVILTNPNDGSEVVTYEGSGVDYITVNGVLYLADESTIENA